MKNKNVFLTMTIIFLIVVVATAGYAYFNTNMEVEGNIEATVNTIGTKSAFTANIGNELNLDVNIETLTPDNIGNSVSNSNSNIEVSLLAGSDGNVTCTYNIEFVWDGDPYNKTAELPMDSEGQKIENSADGEEPDAGSEEDDSETYKFELSLQGTSQNEPAVEGTSDNTKLVEINLDDLTWDEDKKKATIITGATINNASTTTPTKVNWNFELKFYVLPTDQNKLLKKQYKGHLAVTNVVC